MSQIHCTAGRSREACYTLVSSSLILLSVAMFATWGLPVSRSLAEELAIPAVPQDVSAGLAPTRAMSSASTDRPTIGVFITEFDISKLTPAAFGDQDGGTR